VTETKPLLRSLVPGAYAPLAAAAGQPAYRAGQLRGWVLGRGAMSWDDMSNLPRTWRDELATTWDLAGLEPQERQLAADGTRKFLFRLRDGDAVESVIIPMAGHATFCVSSQVGCAMACRFCATARGGLVRDLEPGEIIEQVQRLAADLEAQPVPGLGDRAYNVVFMGMGEPLDAWDSVAAALAIMTDPDGLGMSRRRIQISTSGPREGMQKLIAAQPGVGLTLSLGGVDDESRRKLMPVPGRTPVAEAVGLAEQYARTAGRRVTIAWVLIEDATDTLEQAQALTRLLRGRPFKVNLIPMNPLHDDALARPARERTLAFQKVLTDAGIDAFIRESGGRDIDAACGQLRRRRRESA
jgi:23S rRNA (adenine2503-C2)-methyltransferase